MDRYVILIQISYQDNAPTDLLIKIVLIKAYQAGRTGREWCIGRGLGRSWPGKPSKLPAGTKVVDAGCTTLRATVALRGVGFVL